MSKDDVVNPVGKLPGVSIVHLKTSALLVLSLNVFTIHSRALQVRLQTALVAGT